MKKKILILLSVLFVCTLLIAQEEVRIAYITMNTPVTTLAASSTNSTAGNIFTLVKGETPLRIYVSASGVPADTDGSGALTIKFSTASGGVTTNNFDTAAFSSIRLVLSNGMATATLAAPITKSDWFVGSGIRFLRVGQMENTYAGAVSNISVITSYNF